MSLIIAGTIRVPPQNLEAMRPHMLEVMTASQAEDGCVAYVYALDVAEPGLVRIFEIWRDQAAIDAHFKTDHMARWRAVWPQFQVTDRKLSVFEAAGERPI